MNHNKVSQSLMNLLVSRDFEPTALNAQGQAPTNDSPAISFSFSFKGNTDKDYGTVVILLSLIHI